MKLNWSALSYGPLARDEITVCVQDVEWQKTRRDLVGVPLDSKYFELRHWLRTRLYRRSAQVQVTNYISALRRGGLIK